MIQFLVEAIGWSFKQFVGLDGMRARLCVCK